MYVIDEGGPPLSRKAVVVQASISVWSSAIGSLYSLLLILGLFSNTTRPDAAVAIGIVGLYGIHSQRTDTCRFALFMLWISFIVDALWFALLGPLHLTQDQIASAVSSNCWRETGDIRCYLTKLGTNLSMSGYSLETALAVVMLVLKVVVLYLSPGHIAWLTARHGKTQVQQLAGWSKKPVALANAATFSAKVVLLLGCFALLLRRGRDMSLLPAVLVLIAAIERRRTLLVAALLYTALSLAWDVYWVLTSGLGDTTVSGAADALKQEQPVDLVSLGAELSTLQLFGTLVTLLCALAKLVLFGLTTALALVKEGAWNAPPLFAESSMTKWAADTDDSVAFEEGVVGSKRRAAGGAGETAESQREELRLADITLMMEAAGRKEAFWASLGGALAHALLVVSLATTLARQSSTPLVAAWLVFCTGLRACKLIDASSSLKRTLLSGCIGLMVACLATDVFWLLQFADAAYVARMAAVVDEVGRGQLATALAALNSLQMGVAVCTVLASCLELLLVLVLLKAFASVRFPREQQIAWQQQAEAEWRNRCTSALTLNFTIAFLTAALALAVGAYHSSASLVLPVLSAWSVARSKLQSSPLVISCVLMLLSPMADLLWLLLGEDITLHQFVLILTGRIDVVNQFDLGLKLVLVGSALTLLTCMIAVLLMLILKATVVPRERRRPPCSVGVFKGLATLLLLLGLLASYEAFAPSLVVGAICLILASTFDEANLPEQQLLAWLFWFCGASCLLAQALWLLWFGAQPQLLKLLSDYLEHKDVSYFQRDASAISKLAGGFVEELGSGDEEVDLGGHVQDTTGDLLHLALTAASFVVLVIAMCVATAFKLGGAPPAAAPLV